MSQPDDTPSAPTNPFQSPSLHQANEPATLASGEAADLPVEKLWERPTPAEMLSIVVSVFATLAIARRTSAVLYGDAPLRTVANLFVGITLAAVPLLVIRIKTNTWRGVSPGVWLWFGCACERCLYLAMPFALAFEPLPDWQLLIPPLMILVRGACYSLPLFFCTGLWWRATGLLEVLWSAFMAAALLMDANFVNPANRTLAYVAVLVSLTVAILCDRAQGIRHGWSHWCGVLVFVFWTAKELWPIIQAVGGLR